MRLLRTPLVLLAVLFVLAGVSFATAAIPINWPVPVAPPDTNPAVFAAPRNEWMQKFADNLARRDAGGIDLLFQGDSITEGWKRPGSGAGVWARRYAKLRAACFGIGGDRTEHVLWRLRRGEVDGLSPKLIVLMIGTNNLGRDTAEQVAEGVLAVAAELRARCPQARLLLLGIFPRAERPDDPLRVKLTEVNQRLQAATVDPKITYLDIGARFLAADGGLTREIMPDLLHPNERGYEIWADAIESVVKTYLPVSQP